MISPLLETMRPHQWVKNSFVLAPLIFAQQATDLGAMTRAVVATLLFCAVSGAVYLMNDAFDIEKDRAHPTKRNRPIPSGRLSVRAALRASRLLAVLSVGLGALLSWQFAAATALYFTVNLAYSRKLKNIPYLDVCTIAFGFLIRITAGALAIGVPMSVWILTCTFTLALFMGLGKRRHELLHAESQAASASTQRAVLDAYGLPSLTAAMLTAALVTVAAYTAYAVEDHTLDFGTDLLPITIPFCVVGLARFFMLSSDASTAQSPTEQITRDAPFLLNLAAWGVITVALIYFL